jgi:hypothetical protein
MPPRGRKPDIADIDNRPLVQRVVGWHWETRAMLTWTVDRDIEERLESLGAKTESGKTALLRKVVVEMLEELEDIRMAENVMANPGRRYTLEEVEREFGLDG